MAMSVEDVAHPAYAYIDAGITLIPITPGLKTPAKDLLPNKQWGGYRSRPSTVGEVAGWLRDQPDCNWAAVCGNGLGCGDIDDVHAAQWALANPTHPVLQGACIVRSGSGRCHVWFRYTPHLGSTIWRLLPGRNMGEIRAEGNYVLVPPSALSTGGPYQRVAGSFVTLPTLTDPERYLESIVQAYRAENPDQHGVEPNLSSKRILTLDAARAAAVEQRVRLGGFKKKITDTLFVDGHQTPGMGHWEKLDRTSHSEIDFAVCCEFIRKDWPFDDVEEVFASTRVGLACYRDSGRANHGQGYLFRTYENARKAVEAQVAAARQAQGANFKVVQADLLDMGDDKHYTLVLLDPQDKRYTVRVTSKQLRSETLFCDACAAQARFFPRFNPNQSGKAFSYFSEAVDRTVGEVTYPPEILTDVGGLAEKIWQLIRHMPIWTDPPTTHGVTSRYGWRVGNAFWIRLGLVLSALENQHVVRRGDGALVLRALQSLGEVHPERKEWPDSTPEKVMRLALFTPGAPALRALPSSS